MTATASLRSFFYMAGGMVRKEAPSQFLLSVKLRGGVSPKLTMKVQSDCALAGNPVGLIRR